MPQISYFYGITIYIQFMDHNPPHIHAVYQSCKAQYSIAEAKLLKGKMPNKADQLICEWIKLRKVDLLKDWDLAKEGKPVYPVSPLE
jgi:hypothetical protein